MNQDSPGIRVLDCCGTLRSGPPKVLDPTCRGSDDRRTASGRRDHPLCQRQPGREAPAPATPSASSPEERIQASRRYAPCRPAPSGWCQGRRRPSGLAETPLHLYRGKSVSQRVARRAVLGPETIPFRTVEGTGSRSRRDRRAAHDRWLRLSLWIGVATGSQCADTRLGELVYVRRFTACRSGTPPGCSRAATHRPDGRGAATASAALEARAVVTLRGGRIRIARPPLQ